MIKSLKAKIILDSRKKQTIQVKLITDKGKFKTSVPSGASTGKYEAKSLEVSKAIRNVNEIIAPKLIGKNAAEQEEIDRLMIELDGTENKSKLGANAILGVSMAVCRAGAFAQKIPLYQYLSQKLRGRASQCFLRCLPRPAFNIINGGVHADNELDIQEFMIAPCDESFSKNLQTGINIYKKLRQVLVKKLGKQKVKIGDEGGFSPLGMNIDQAMDSLIESISHLVEIGLDCAASRLYKDGNYCIEGKKLNQRQILDFYKNLLTKYPVSFIEDLFAEEDWVSWKKMNSEIKKQTLEAFLIGDDLTVTNKERVKKAIRNKCLGGIIVKPNQVGTITETLECVKIAKRAGLKIMVSHRSGETMDDFIADLAVGISADFIKSGAPGPKERMAKYNRLLEIEKICQ